MRLRVLLACAVLPLVLWAVVPVGVLGQGKLQGRIDSTRSKIGKKKGTERVLTQDISAYTQRIRRLQGRIGSLQRREQTIQADLDQKKAQLVATQQKLRDERARLTRLRARLAETRRVLARRLVEIYEAQRPDLLSVVLNSNGFEELLSRGEFIKRISDQDQRIITTVRDAKRDATATAKRLDKLEQRQQQITLAVLARRNEIAMVKKDLIGTRVGYEQTQADKRHALVKVRGDRQQLEDHLDVLEKEQAKIRAQLAAAAGQAPDGPIKHGSGQFIWPVNGSISSGFGGRSSPGGIGSTYHEGIDIPEPIGTPIHAAAAGRVAIAGVMSGYGNYTCIQHSASLSTCYGHQNSIAVHVGQSVSQGQVIGQTGNTGHSTGPHLHFEVRINGSAVDPMGYL